MKKLITTIFLFAALGAAGKGLTRQQADALKQQAWAEQKALLREELKEQWDAKIMHSGELKMHMGGGIYGKKPADGRSLFISMHGGGNTTAEMNDGQWRNQIMLYRPAEGVYIAPRAAVDDWNMWFRPHIDTLFESIIRAAVVFEDVNPNKVYVMGYSAGGDGVYRLAPRLADHWAAASMMAGHPGEASPLNLRNIGFTLWMGSEDAAYDRNKLAAEYAARLDSLQAADPAGYVHDVHIVPGSGHWMNRADSVAVPWMAKFVRNPRPSRIVWRQEETGLRPAFYWLSVPSAEMRGGMEVRVERNGNRFEITRNDYSSLKIWLDDAMIDFRKPVEVWQNGKRVFRGRVERSASVIAETAASRKDSNYIFSAVVEIK